MKKIFFVVLAVILVIGLVACNSQKSNNGETTNPNNNVVEEKKYGDVEKNPIVTMTMENGDVIVIELYPKIAPQTVENFISLINKGFYNGLTFHRVIPGFVAQGGDSNGNGTGDAGYSIYGEFLDNGFDNTLSHDVGVISMARSSGNNNSASSQFFIVTGETAKFSLDGLYAGFGKVIEGMDAVYTIVDSEVIRREYSEDLANELNALAAQGDGAAPSEELIARYYNETMEIDKPVNPPVIASMTVDTFGYSYDEPTHY